MKLSNLSFSVSVFLLSGLLSACKSENYQFNIPSSPYPVSEDSFSLDTLAEGFTIPFGLAVVNEDEYFITDRLGDFFHYQQGSLTKIKGTPKVTYFDDPGIAAIKHGGLMDVSLHPNYAQNGWIYMAFLATSGHAKAVRLKVEGDKITELEELFASRDQIYLGNGMRIVWQDAQHFFLNVGGSAYSTRNNPVMLAQDFQMDAGKIHRLLEDGGVPADNPILPGLSSPTSIWSYGHRDAQGFHYEAASETFLAIEHGPKGGDEFNVILPGKNYGWPLFSYGLHYDNQEVSLISEDSAAVISVLPEHQWTIGEGFGRHSIAPACLLKVSGSNVSDWNGYFLLGSLAYRRLLKFNRSTGETFGLPIEGRVRTIQQLPSGDILALIERRNTMPADGVLVRISN